MVIVIVLAAVVAKLIPFVVALTSAIVIIIELGPLSMVSMVGIASGSVIALFNIKSDFLFKGDGDRDVDSLVSIFFTDGGESNDDDGGSLKFSMSKRSLVDGVLP